MIHTYSFSEPGGHIINEDAFVLRPLAEMPDYWMACIADGQGGRAGGAKAAQLACIVCAERVQDIHANWQDVLTIADQTVATNTDAGFTTVAAFIVGENAVRGASCGDSAVIAVSAGREPEVLTSRQYKNPPVGSGEAAFVPFTVRLEPPWKVLAVTDGVWKYAGWPRLFEFATSLKGEELIAELQNAARLRVSHEFPDDFTIILLQCE
jgi:hypothetical protein